MTNCSGQPRSRLKPHHFAPGTVLCLLSAALTLTPIASAEELRNPFGVMLGGDGLRMPERVALAKELGVPYFRPWDLSLDEWKGRHPDAEAIQQAGFKIIMTVRNNGRGGPPPRPASPPASLEAYKKVLGEVLDAYRPALLVVENEENSGLYYLGTPKQYGAELKAACEVAHSRGIPCTNGGLVSSLVASLVWNHYREKGEAAKAADFLKRTATPNQQRLMRSPQGAQRIGDALTRGKALLGEYKSAGIDYVNFHWYIPDSAALAEAVEFLRAETGLQPITNEIGQHGTDPEVVEPLLVKVVELKLPYAVWFSLDRPDAKALQGSDGALRPNGLAFKAFIEKQFGGPTPIPAASQ